MSKICFILLISFSLMLSSCAGPQLAQLDAEVHTKVQVQKEFQESSNYQAFLRKSPGNMLILDAAAGMIRELSENEQMNLYKNLPQLDPPEFESFIKKLSVNVCK